MELLRQVVVAANESMIRRLLKEVVKALRCYRGTGTITTVDGTTEYNLATDILLCPGALIRVKYSTTAELYRTGTGLARKGGHAIPGFYS